ncbi:MAG: A24 family peptidase [Pseudomonadota bacterium]
MPFVIPFIAVLGALILLFALSWIDLKDGILPNPLVLLFGLCGLAFHASVPVLYIDWPNIALGAALGGGVLLFIRTLANWLYKGDTLGLGDVKLMLAAGVWLGSHFVLIALIVGAIAGLLHGFSHALALGIKDGKLPDLTKLSIPAGPGFAFGILVAGAMLFHDFPSLALEALNNL